MVAKYRDSGWLHEQYNENGLTLAGVAALAGCTPTTIANRMERYGFVRRTNDEVHRHDLLESEVPDGLRRWVMFDSQQIWHDARQGNVNVQVRCPECMDVTWRRVCDVRAACAKGKWTGLCYLCATRGGEQ